MLTVYHLKALSDAQITTLTDRGLSDDAAITKAVIAIGEEVSARGDAALFDFSRRFDRVELDLLAVPPADIKAAAKAVSPAIKDAIALAAENIRRFHEAAAPQTVAVEIMPGVRAWREFRPLERAGFYIPGGSAPLFSTVLMLGIPARIAGCTETVLCTPPGPQGNIAPEILYAADLLGITNIFRVGGAQAIFAMAWGTASIPKVDKIFGPGNRFVTAAKQQVQSSVAIDMPAGPSEVLVVADQSADPDFIASDLLSQAEHGADSQAVLVTSSAALTDQVQIALARQLKILPRHETAAKALANSFAIITDSVAASIAFANRYAPEHLILHLDDWQAVIPQIKNAGSVFCGAFSPESAGDYASGTNHILPTAGFARSYSGVSVASFGKYLTFQHLTPAGLKALGPAVQAMAEAEGLAAHAHAVGLRLPEA